MVVAQSPLKIEDLLLFILANSRPNMGIKKLNKLAFFLEFTYLFEFDKPLTDAEYAAINMGPVINDYKNVIQRMKKGRLIERNTKIDGEIEDYLPLVKPATMSVELSSFLLQVLERYERLSPKQLEDLTHTLDSYNITVHENSGKMGGVIDKDLAMLDYDLSLIPVAE